jgi:polyribonucleotide nucleotidyltransferase
MIGAVIGPGGKVIQEIQRVTEATIVIEEIDNLGVVEIYASNLESIDKALKWIKGIVAVPEVGEIYEGPIKSITSFGAFVEFLPGKEGLLHISEIDWKRLATVDEALKQGETVKIKLIGIENGKFRLSRKALLPRPEKKPNE